VLLAAAGAAGAYGIPVELFAAFLHSMRMDLAVCHYPDRAALDEYVYGSAEVIGLQVLPVLGTVTDAAQAAPYAAVPGKAFQLTNFLRDVAEDLARGRVYLPADELAACGVDADRLGWCARAGRRESFRGLPRTPPCNALAFALKSPTFGRRDLPGLDVRSGPRCRPTTTASWPGCASTRQAARRPAPPRSSRPTPTPPATSMPSPRRAGCANPTT
jgi:hypothetical protein